jgi:hypothetical protein
MSRTIVGALVVLVAACTSPTGPFQVTARIGSLQLENSSPKAVYYVLIESETATRVDWANPSTCLNVAPRAAASIPYAQIMGYEPGDAEAILYWWHLQPAASGGFQVDSIRAKRVRLWPGA